MILGLLFWETAPLHAGETVRSDDKFVLVTDALYSTANIDYLRSQLDVGLAALENFGLLPDPALFPVTVKALGGRGISRVGPRGDIVLYRLSSDRAPILHELTHLVAGYAPAVGHWTQEGFAAYMQDSFGGNPAYPAYGMAHKLAGIIAEQDQLLPMDEVLVDRDRRRFFGFKDSWTRWRAEAQSTSFVTFLIERYGVDAFLVIHNQPVETIPFEVVFGALPSQLIKQWRDSLPRQDPPDEAAQRIYNRYHRTAR